MRCLLLLTFLISSYTSFSQDSTNFSADSQHRADVRRANMQRIDSLDSLDRARDMQRNFSNIVSWQQERNKKEKKQAIMRIAIGVTMLAFLVIVTIRRRRKAKK